MEHFAKLSLVATVLVIVLIWKGGEWTKHVDKNFLHLKKK